MSNPFREDLVSRTRPEACTVVIFGATGDLTHRKLVPALYNLALDGELPPGVKIIGFARREKTDAEFRTGLEELNRKVSRTGHDDAVWSSIAPNIHYHQSEFTDADGYARLAATLDAIDRDRGGKGNRLFYIASAPEFFDDILTQLKDAGLNEAKEGCWARVIVEKPFGTDLATAQHLNHVVNQTFKEKDTYRIDHYLGKETAQNIMVLRFANSLFEPNWNSRYIDHIQITCAENLGMEGGRGGYYDTAGALRDMVQNHLLQVLALVAMEPPNSMDANAVRSEKVKVLDALNRMTPEQVARDVVRAQYAGYHQEKGVPPASETETYVAIRATLHNWRWNGVPILLRTGKRLEARFTQVVLRFRTPPVDLLGGPLPDGTCALRPNALTLLIQPREGIRLGFLVKQPGTGVVMRPAELGFDYADLGAHTVPAYQRLLLDAIKGNATLFIRGDETEAAWRFVDAIRDGWQHPEAPPPARYAPRSHGPEEADGLFRGCEGIWSGPEAHR
jgi:glucose-6-phosphate 1-dehydrogenase